MSQSYLDRIEALPVSQRGVVAAAIASEADAALSEALAQLAQVKAERDGLRKDAERLDWMERQDLESLAMCIVKDGPNDGEYMVYGDGAPGFGKTFRDAIDGARDAAIASREGAV